MSLQRHTSHWMRIKWATSGILAAVFFVTAAAAIAADKPQSAEQEISGEEIFRREWIPNDPRSHGGDGLGPVFNESSCVACHNQGGVGGGGPAEKNVRLLTSSVPDLKQLQKLMSESKRGSKQAPEEIARQHKVTVDRLASLHPDLGTSSTQVIHTFGVDTTHGTWLSSIENLGLIEREGQVERAASFNEELVNAINQIRAADSAMHKKTSGKLNDSAAMATIEETSTFPVLREIVTKIALLQQKPFLFLMQTTRQDQIGIASVSVSQRNASALFGSGLIDSIPAVEIELGAKRKNSEFPRISGRVNRLKNGKIGRFGWKAQEASLYDFTMTACAVELGLHVPDHPQSRVPYKPEVKPSGLDLNQPEADALVNYLRTLPRPVQSGNSHPAVASLLSEGEKLFTSVGCMACHTKTLGKVDGLFSDLLLHDMGPDLNATGSYGSQTPLPEPVPVVDAKTGKPKPVPPSQQEWRTPPLWGVRDSAPYLHDGRAATLEQAIAFHGGEAADARLRFFMQPHEKRQKIITFLKSLTAPDTTTAER